MFRRLMMAVAMAWLVAVTMVAGAMAGGHGGSAPDRGPLTAMQHRMADALGWDWLHPAMPVPTHGEHAAWEMVRGDVLAVAGAHANDPLVARWANDVALYARGFAAAPHDMDAQHRLDEATAALAQVLAWRGRSDPQVASLLAHVDATLALNGDDALCGSEDVLARDATGHGQQVETTPTNPEQRLLLMALAVLLCTLLLGPPLASRRRT